MRKPPSSHLVIIVEIFVLKALIGLTSFGLCLANFIYVVELDLRNYNLLNLMQYSLEFVSCLILGHFRSFLEVHTNFG